MVLLDMCLILRGTREGIMYVQYQRNVLVTMCRPLLGPSLLFKGETIPTSGDLSVRDWARWALVESWKRVLYFAWCECAYRPLRTDVNDKSRRMHPAGLL